MTVSAAERPYAVPSLLSAWPKGLGSGPVDMLCQTKKSGYISELPRCGLPRFPGSGRMGLMGAYRESSHAWRAMVALKPGWGSLWASTVMPDSSLFMRRLSLILQGFHLLC